MTDDEVQQADPGLARLGLIRDVEEFLIREVALLDDRRFEDWVELFTEDGFYWAPATPDQESPQEEVSLFYDDVAMMRTRFARLRHPRVHSQTPPSRTSHMISNVLIEAHNAELGALEVSARFMMLEFRPGNEQRCFGGRYDYALLRDREAGFRIAAKKATVLNSDDVHMAIAVPF